MAFSGDKMLAILHLLLLSTLSKATITITETGEHFASRPDHLVGTRFLEGYEYMARLQVFSSNLHLCPDPSNHHLNLTVQVPLDGLPVAILAKNGACSVESKARLASLSVEPPGRLKYLIVYGDSRLETPAGLRPLDRDPHITVGILHVDERSGRELLRTLNDQSGTIKEAGGPRLLLDGRDVNNRFARDVALWMGVAVMMMSCLFSFVLSVRAQRQGFQHQTVVVPREAPRRLTMEQVDELLPEYNAGEENLVVHQGQEACSICLDEYQAGDKCRCLPCGHTFHSRCISKWLTERSCTCPLCKTDLLQDEDDEDSEYVELREGGTQTEDDFSRLPMGSVFARMDRFFSSAQQAWRQRRRGEQGQEELTADEEGVSQLPLLEESETEN